MRNPPGPIRVAPSEGEKETFSSASSARAAGEGYSMGGPALHGTPPGYNPAPVQVRSGGRPFSSSPGFYQYYASPPPPPAPVPRQHYPMPSYGHPYAPPPPLPQPFAAHHPLSMPPMLPFVHEQRRRQRLKRETALAAFDALPLVSVPSPSPLAHGSSSCSDSSASSGGSTTSSASSSSSNSSNSTSYMVSRTVPPQPFWENILLLSSNPAILGFLRDFGRCDWMDVDVPSLTVRMSCGNLDQLRLTDEVLVQWLRYYDPSLPFWTLFATISTYSGFMVGKLVGHLRNIEATTGAKVWVAPRDPESTYVSFFICGNTEESTMLAYQALQSREMAALALGEKVGTMTPSSPANGPGQATEEEQEEQDPRFEEGMRGLSLNEREEEGEGQSERVRKHAAPRHRHRGQGNGHGNVNGYGNGQGNGVESSGPEAEEEAPVQEATQEVSPPELMVNHQEPCAA